MTERQWKHIAWSIIALLVLFALLALTSRTKADGWAIPCAAVSKDDCRGGFLAGRVAQCPWMEHLVCGQFERLSYVWAIRGCKPCRHVFPGRGEVSMGAAATVEIGAAVFADK